MKCRPMNRSGRSDADARRVIEIDEVLEARMVLALRCGVRALKIDFLTSSFSVAASMAMSVPPIICSSGAAFRWFMAASMVA
ncbi:hypothetical protein GALL_493540 [mine drainage metagenome]|uniref:Uncharacterized protein n=1 Tax=mine drainage metagenome TaxID=410659 RepID=A0A1J5PE51_9ZZZZ